MKYKCIGSTANGEEVSLTGKPNSFTAGGELYILQTISTNTEHFYVYVHEALTINEAIKLLIDEHKPATLVQEINNDANAQLNKAKDALRMVVMLKRVGGMLPGVKEMIDNVVREAEEVLGAQEDLQGKIPHCSMCGNVQRPTPSGLVCSNGHGGADSLY